MYVVRSLLFIWLIDVWCMVCMLFIRLLIPSSSSEFYPFYTFATMANDNATTILVFVF